MHSTNDRQWSFLIFPSFSFFHVFFPFFSHSISAIHLISPAADAAGSAGRQIIKYFFKKKHFSFGKVSEKLFAWRLAFELGGGKKNLPVPNKTANSAASQTSEKNVEKKNKKRRRRKIPVCKRTQGTSWSFSFYEHQHGPRERTHNREKRVVKML